MIVLGLLDMWILSCIWLEFAGNPLQIIFPWKLKGLGFDHIRLEAVGPGKNALLYLVWMALYVGDLMNNYC